MAHVEHETARHSHHGGLGTIPTTGRGSGAKTPLKHISSIATDSFCIEVR